MSHRHPPTISTRFIFFTLLIALFGPGRGSVVAQPQPTFAVLAHVDDPYGGVIGGSDGALYGTSRIGPAGSNCGYVYRLDRQSDGSYLRTILHSFAGAPSDGCQPSGELVEGPNGVFTGTTRFGGPHTDGGFVAMGTGTIYQITSTGSITFLRPFAAQGLDGVYPEGYGPLAGLTRGSDGLLYGTTGAGGTGSYVPAPGTLFRLTSAGELQVIHNFGVFPADDVAPQDSLTLAADGSLYGAFASFSSGGDASDNPAGGMFRLTAAGVYSRAFTFPHISSCGFVAECYPLGANPAAPPTEANGDLYVTGNHYGAPPGGYGTIVRVDAGGIGHLIHGFTGGADGGYPHRALTLGVDGNLYGLTSGANQTGPTIFRVAPDGSTFSTVYELPLGGAGPQGRLLEIAPGEFIGTSTGNSLGAGYVFRLSLNGFNNPPVASDGSATTAEDTTLFNGQLVATDPDNDDVDFAIVTNGTLGQATRNEETGEFTYQPFANAFGTDTFTFQAIDINGGISNTATITVTITPVNDPPQAADSAISTTENTAADGNFNATDIDSPITGYTIVSNPNLGTVEILDVASGQFRYTPNPGATGSDVFAFVASDGSLSSNAATVLVQITDDNNAPVARTGVVTTTEGAPVSGALQAIDADGGPLTFTVLTQPAQGTVTITDAGTGAFTYTPGASAIGYDTFTFQVSDGSAASSGTEMVFIVASSPRWPGQTVRASVAPDGTQADSSSLEPKTSANGRFVAFHSQASNLVVGDTNSSSDVFILDRLSGHITRVSVGNGGLQSNGNSVSPALSADGRFVAFESSASNLVVGDTNGLVDIFVHDRQTGDTTRVSVASDSAQANGISSGSALSGDGRFVTFNSPASNLVSSDTNSLFDLFVHDRQTGRTELVSIGMANAAANGPSAGTAISADGRFVAFNSSASNLVVGDTNGAYDVFVRDRYLESTTRINLGAGGAQANGQSFPAATISATGRFVAFGSDATNLVSGDTNGRTDVFLHDRQTGETTRVSVADDGSQADGVSSAPHISADGRFVAFNSVSSNLSPGDANGVHDVFVHDSQGATTTRVSRAGDGTLGNFASLVPSMSADGQFVAFRSEATNLVSGDTNGVQDVFVVGGVAVSPLSGNYDAGGGTGAIDVAFVYPGTSWSAVSQAPWITITDQSSPDGNGVITYSVAANTSGSARTGTLTVAAQTATIQQDGVSTPIAQDSAIGTNEDTAVNGSLTANDPNGDPLTFSIVANGTLGTAVVTNPSTGAFTYTPNANAFGSDAFTFQASDGSSTSNVATMTVTIASVNDAPVTSNGTLTTDEDAAASGTLSAADIDSPSLTFSIVANATKGTVIVTNAVTGTYTYTPNPNANGADSFTFKANDGSLESNVATVNVTISAANDAPVAQTGVVTTQEGSSVSGMLQATDLEGDAITFSVTTQPSQGSVSLTNAATGAFTYAPNVGGIGYDTFTFEVSDGTATSTGTEMVFIVASSPRWPGQTVRVSVTSSGAQTSSSSDFSDLSADGRYIAFRSHDSLVPGDTGFSDIFVHDRQTRETRKVSLSTAGLHGNNDSWNPAISSNGRHVAFYAFAWNLVPDDTNSTFDVLSEISTRM